MSCALALIALGVGYMVFLSANREKEGLKILGQVIGILIMIGAVMSTLCSMSKCMRKGHCSMSSSGAPMCPVSKPAKEAPQQ